MTLLITSKPTGAELEKAAEDLEGYIKVVVDIEKKILTAGGVRHAEGEELLLKNGSRQENLWGGGFDQETGEVDFDSMINIRPAQNNRSREILSPEIRTKVEEIIRDLLQ